MAEKKSIFGRIRLVFCRSNPRTKLLLLLMLVLLTTLLLGMRVYLMDAKSQNVALREQAAALEQENDRLDHNIAVRGTIQGVKQIAGEELGLVDPNTTFFTPVEATNPQ